jgi:hypothetical protein
VLQALRFSIFRMCGIVKSYRYATEIVKLEGRAAVR